MAWVSPRWLRDSGFRSAVGDYLQQEREHVQQYVNQLREHLPYRTTGVNP